MAAKLGLDGKLYFLTTGTRATWGVADSDGFAAAAAPANLNEITNVINVTRSVTKGEAEASIRGHNGWGAVLATLKRGELNIEMIYDPADTDMIAIYKAFNTNAVVAMAVLSGASTVVGTRGLWADFEILSIEHSEPLEEAQTVTVTAKPSANTAVAPEMVKVTA